MKTARRSGCIVLPITAEVTRKRDEPPDEGSAEEGQTLAPKIPGQSLYPYQLELGLKNLGFRRFRTL